MGLKYIGPRFFIGVPARDLTEAQIQEAKKLGYARADLLKSGAYIEAPKQSKSKRGNR